MAGTTAEDFHLEQLKSVRAEHDEALKETRALERYAIVGTGAVWAFLLGTSHQDRPMLDYGWFIPVFFAIAGGIRAAMLHWQMKRIDKYVRQAEAYFPLPSRLDGSHPPQGWESHKFHESDGKITRLTWFAIAFWAVLLFISAALAMIAFR